MLDEEIIHSPIRNRLGELLEKHPLTEKTVTHKEMADAVGISRSALTNILLGNQRPPIYVLYRAADYFGVAITDILPTVEEVKNSSLSLKINVGEDEHNLEPKARLAVEKLRKKL